MKNVLYWLHHLLLESLVDQIRRKSILETLEVQKVGHIPEVVVHQEGASHVQEKNIPIHLEEVDRLVTLRIWPLAKKVLLIRPKMKDTIHVQTHPDIEKVYCPKLRGAVYLNF